MSVTQYQIFCRYFNGDLNRSVTNETPCEWVSKSEDAALKLYCNNTANQAMFKDLDEHLRGVAADGVIRRRKDFSLEENECYKMFERRKELEVLKKKGLLAYEIVQIEPMDHMYSTSADSQHRMKKAKLQRDLAHWETISKETDIANPKYDMIFMYNGLAQTKGPICNGNTMIEDYGQFDGQTTSNIYCLNPIQKDPHQQPYIYYDNMKRVSLDIWFEHSVHASLTSAMNKVRELINIVGKRNIKVGKVVPLDKYVQIV